jgi:hypothetical protein
MNFVVLSGLIAGSMTDPPALAFASTLMNDDALSVSYAAVYPLAMLLRIFCAQFLVLLLVWRGRTESVTIILSPAGEASTEMHACNRLFPHAVNG